MKRDPEFFGEQELALVYMARRLKDALAAEKALTGCGLDYAVETGPYQSGLLFRTTKTGAFIYVAPQDEERARTHLLNCGFNVFDPAESKIK